MTKICDIPYPIYDLTKIRHPIYDLGKKFDTLFMTVAAGTVALSVSYEGLFLIVLSIMMKR